MSEFEGIELVQKDTVFNRAHALGIGRMPGRKQICLYLREGSRLTPVAFFRDDVHADEVKRWLAMLGGEG